MDSGSLPTDLWLLQGLNGPTHMQPMMMVPSPYGNGNEMPNGLAAPDYGPVAAAIPSVGNLGTALTPMHTERANHPTAGLVLLS